MTLDRNFGSTGAFTLVNICAVVRIVLRAILTFGKSLRKMLMSVVVNAGMCGKDLYVAVGLGVAVTMLLLLCWAGDSATSLVAAVIMLVLATMMGAAVTMLVVAVTCSVVGPDKMLRSVLADSMCGCSATLWSFVTGSRLCCGWCNRLSNLLMSFDG